jgi:putative hydrolase of the HAD superfamily
MKYQNYIFDLYGTLVDIETDEDDAAFWRSFSLVLKRYGKAYDAGELQRKYRDMVQKSEENMRREKGFDLIEIKIEDVFRRLLDSVMVTEAEMNDICGSFRRLSTKKIGLFPDTLKVLDVLKRNGKKIYMLSTHSIRSPCMR